MLVVEQEVQLGNQTQLVEIYRIVAESLANARKHAHADGVVVRVGTVDGEDESRPGDRAYIEVEDDGRGLPEGVAEGRNHGFGLRSIGIRANRIGGTVNMYSVPGQGTRVRIEFMILPVDSLTRTAKSVNDEDSRIDFFTGSMGG